MKPGLPEPAADMEGIGETDENVNGCKIDRNCSAGGESPRKQGQSEERHTVRGQRYCVIAEPTVAVRHVAVLTVHLEPVDLPEEKDGEYKVGELMRELHQPEEVVPQAGNQEHCEERYETDSQV